MIVIPAEAGIQKIRDWIPIFMGMTEISVIRDIRGKMPSDYIASLSSNEKKAKSARNNGDDVC